MDKRDVRHPEGDLRGGFDGKGFEILLWCCARPELGCCIFGSSSSRLLPKEPRGWQVVEWRAMRDGAYTYCYTRPHPINQTQ